MRSLRVVAIGLALLAGSAWPVAGPPAAACASDAPHAGLVVDNGSRTLELCVTLDATSVSGLHLIELAHEQSGLSYSLGQGGQAVCRLDGVGPQGDDCFADYPDFWGYWHGDGRGGWTWSSVGGASYQVDDGALESWVWGAGDTGATHPAPPSVSAADVCPVTTPSPTATSSAKPTPSNVPGTQVPKAQAHPTATATDTTSSPRSSSPGATRTDSDRSPVSSPSRGASTTPAETAAGVVRAAGPPAPGGPPPAGGGPPAGLFVALALALALGVGGWLRLRSHPRGRT